MKNIPSILFLSLLFCLAIPACSPTMATSAVPTAIPPSLTPEPTNTPTGRFNIQVKMPSKHMGDADLAAGIDDYVIPGVPWVSFFTERGHAFHGTYWHDNFGVPMSHGCLNMRTAEAKWLFRWTLPAAPFEDIDELTLDRKGFGTAVHIF